MYRACFYSNNNLYKSTNAGVQLPKEQSRKDAGNGQEGKLKKKEVAIVRWS